MTFGERIRDARKRKKLTQKDLADLIGAKHNSVSNWENDQNKPDPDTIELLCGVLDVTPSYLLGYDEGISSTNDDEINEYLEELHKRPEMKTLFSVAKKATKEDIEKAVKIIEMLKDNR